jgi:hypothetical protein
MIEITVNIVALSNTKVESEQFNQLGLNLNLMSWYIISNNKKVRELKMFLF